VKYREGSWLVFLISSLPQEVERAAQEGQGMDDESRRINQQAQLGRKDKGKQPATMRDAPRDRQG